MKGSLNANDTVQLSGDPQLWRVVNTINGNKADIQRLNDYNLQIITVTLHNIQVVRLLGARRALGCVKPLEKRREHLSSPDILMSRPV
jgi:hypothetical protein